MKDENKKTLLLVEDEVILAMSEKIFLEKYGYSVITVTTGEEAIEAVKSNPKIDLILMDIDLGEGIDGTEAAEIILKKRDLPVVFLSSHIEPEIVKKTEGITSYGYVVKSSSITVLDASIKMAFKLFDAHKEINQQNMLINAGNENLRVTIEDLEKGKNRLASVFRAAPTGIGVVIDRVMVEVNQRICEMTGYDEKDLIGKTARILYPTQDDFDFVGKEKYAQIKLKGTGTVETHWKCKDGEIIDVLLSSTPLDINDYGKGVTFTALDITERKQAEEALGESEETLSFVMDGVPALLAYLDSDLNFVYLNKAHADWYCKKKEDIVGKHISSVMSEEVYNRALPNLLKVLKGEIVTYDNKSHDQQGHERYVGAKLIPHFSEGKVIGFFTSIIDITARKQAEKALRDSEEKFRCLTEAASIAIYLTDLNGKCIYVNEKWCQYANLSFEQAMQDGWIKGVYEEDRGLIFENWQKMIDSQGTWGFEYRFGTKEHLTWVYGTAQDYKNDLGKIVGYVGINLNISERKIAGDEIKSLLAEKELILKETHHRIKNNFTSIESLLSSQAKATDNEEAKTALDLAMGRVKGMSNLYDTFLLAEISRTTSVKKYLTSLIDDIIPLISNNQNITIETQLDDIEIDSKQLSTIGLIVNELLNNAMKYSFLGRDTGFIKISLKENSGEITLTIQDNGNDLPEGFDTDSQKGFGLMLIKVLSKQLGGSYTMKNHNGTRSIIKFAI